MEYFQMFLTGFIASMLTSAWHRWKSVTGTLKIDSSNPEKDLYRICIDNLDDLRDKKKVILTIEHNADLSQK